MSDDTRVPNLLDILDGNPDLDGLDPDILNRYPDLFNSDPNPDALDDPDPNLSAPSAPSAFDVPPSAPSAFNALPELPDPFAEINAPPENEGKGYIKLQKVTPSREKALSQRQLLALPIIASASTIGDGARNAEISRMTLYRWLQDDDFRDEYNRVRNEIAFLAMQEVKAAMLDAAATLRDCCRDSNGFVRVRAAHSLLSVGNRQLQSEKIDSHLDDLQQALEFMNQRQSP